MEINWTQVIAQMFGTALIVPVSTAVGFLVMRYFPKFWESTIEKPIIKFVKAVKTNGKKEC